MLHLCGSMEIAGHAGTSGVVTVVVDATGHRVARMDRRKPGVTRSDALQSPLRQSSNETSLRELLWSGAALSLADATQTAFLESWTEVALS
jgi:hypothetical protein